MKKYSSILKYVFVIMASLLITSCVHDDKYDDPEMGNFQCLTSDHFTDPANGYTKWTLEQVKALANNTEITDEAYIEGFISSSDESGNIYKTIYIQDKPENPEQGLTVSVDMVSTYTKYPQGSKVYIKLKGLYVSTYGNVKQLGQKTDAGTRIIEKDVPKHIFRDCQIRETIVPKVMTLAQMVTANDQYIGCLIKVENAEFDEKVLCSTYAPDGLTVDRAIRDTSTTTARVVRNSGYASFANKTLPAGNGTFIGIYSKYNTTYQMYIVKDSDLEMNNFPRKTGAMLTNDPCVFDASTLTQKTVAQVKQYFTGGNTWINITDDAYVKAKVVANDESGNLFKYIYIEDETGGIKVNINKNALYQDVRFALGRTLIIKLKDLYIHNVNGELQLGSPYNNNTQFGGVDEVNIYKYFFNSNLPATAVVPTVKSISQLTSADVGRWIKIKDLEFIETDLGLSYSVGTSTVNRTLRDCNGNTIILRTSGYADFSAEEVRGGKGDVSAVLSVYNGTYQLWITKLADVPLLSARCDGSVPPATIFKDGFTNLNNWTAVSVSGTQAWNTSNQGNSGNNYAVMNGYASGTNYENEDWLISKEISLAGKVEATLSFKSDVRYAGPVLQVYATDNFTGDVNTTNWTLLPATLDTNSNAFGDWVSSGSVNLSAFLGNNVRIAFKYTSTTSSAATWEVDDVTVRAK